MQLNLFKISNDRFFSCNSNFKDEISHRCQNSYISYIHLFRYNRIQKSLIELNSLNVHFHQSNTKLSDKIYSSLSGWIYIPLGRPRNEKIVKRPRKLTLKSTVTPGIDAHQANTYIQLKRCQLPNEIPLKPHMTILYIQQRKENIPFHGQLSQLFPFLYHFKSTSYRDSSRILKRKHIAAI